VEEVEVIGLREFGRADFFSLTSQLPDSAVRAWF